MDNRIVEKPVKGLHFKPLCYVIKDTAVGKYVACEEPARYNEKKSYNVSRSIDTAEGFTTTASAKKWIEAYVNGKDDVDTARFIIKPIYPEAFKESAHRLHEASNLGIVKIEPGIYKLERECEEDDVDELHEALSDDYVDKEKEILRDLAGDSKIMDIDAMDKDTTHKLVKAAAKVDDKAKAASEDIAKMKKDTVAKKAVTKGVELDVDVASDEDLDSVSDILDNLDDKEGTAVVNESCHGQSRIREESLHDLSNKYIGQVFYIDSPNTKLFITCDENGKLGFSESFLDAELFQFNTDFRYSFEFDHDHYSSVLSLLWGLAEQNPNEFISKEIQDQYTYGNLSAGYMEVSDPDYYKVDTDALADEYVKDKLYAANIAPSFEDNEKNAPFSVADEDKERRFFSAYA